VIAASRGTQRQRAETGAFDPPRAGSASRASASTNAPTLRGELATRRITVHAVFPGPIDTDMVRAFEMPKTSPDEVAAAIIAGVQHGVDEILPDPKSRELFALWKRDPRELEREFVAMSGAG
jgi:short-subunit dehydrogenase